MAYCTTLNVVNYSGLALRIVDENVGTGDNAEADYDLDKGNIIDGSYSLYHAASGSNAMTDLTDVTHYALDKESGRVVLTAGGITALGTDILYAKYTYTDAFSDSTLSGFITSADVEVEKITGRIWDSPTSLTEYFDGEALSRYPTTDQPYQTDWDAPGFIMLKNHPVTQIEQIFFLENLSIGQFWNYDDGTAAYTDYTDNANSSTEDDFNLFDASPSVDDYIYIGASSRFLGLNTSLSTLGTGSPAIDWEYWNGTTWADITETDVDTGASVFTASGRFTWTYPSSWTATTVNGSSSLYFIRGKLTSGYTIDPIAHDIAIYDGLSDIIHPRHIKFESYGKLWFIEKSIPDGTQNVRVTYKYGASSVPALVAELSAIFVAIRVYVNITGGSYDDPTSYSIGSKSISIGEVYVNVAQVLKNYRQRVKEILDALGRRSFVIA